VYPGAKNIFAARRRACDQNLTVFCCAFFDGITIQKSDTVIAQMRTMELACFSTQTPHSKPKPLDCVMHA
jgi:hypothetical protein